ncbi:type IV pilin-like G/H family protein [Microcoleus vaginatus]|uniref:type IV pilin-like G/H family protein n=1 Tax=Microcoleus vaginatus TaxID=119532 RepID=UPI0016853C32|nr:type IV pilin-like G/H family protein [Microcoleus sp. FACHB-84]MBD2008355.1 type IV pilin-like G/H family protein [Microcoleus sp. FACHB-45]
MSQQNYKSASIEYNGCGWLVLLIVIGVFFSVAVPSFQVKLRNNKQWEPRDYISLINKRQQAYFAKKSVFSNSVKALGIRIIKTETENYKYSHHTTKKATFNYGVSKHKNLKSCVGGVFVIPAPKVESKASKNPITTTSILCGSDSAGTIKPPEPTYQNGKIACATGTIELRQTYD